MATDDASEETVRVVADVPESVKEGAQAKLEYGGLTREIRNRLEEIAFGADLNQRSRLERQRDEFREEIRTLREQRREIDAEIATYEDKLDAVEEKLSALTTAEDKYETKLEELEGLLRHDGQRVDPSHPAVERAAATGGVEPEGVIRDLQDRNPDVPDYAFEDGVNDFENEWNGLPDAVADRDVGERGEVDP